MSTNRQTETQEQADVAKLTQDRANEMRTLHTSGALLGYKALGRAFDVSENVARDVCLGRVWNADGSYPRKPCATFEKDVKRSFGGKHYPLLTMAQWAARILETA